MSEYNKFTIVWRIIVFLWLFLLTCAWMHEEDNFTVLKIHLNNIHEYEYENDTNILKLIKYLNKNS